MIQIGPDGKRENNRLSPEMIAKGDRGTAVTQQMRK